MLALIDADILVYRVGFTTENEEAWIAKARANEMVESILAETGATEYQLWLSDNTKNNFRLAFYPHYKANRKDFVLPKWYDLIKEHLIREWKAQMTVEQEADDALGIAQDKGGTFFDIPPEVLSTVICSIDKDLLQVPGNHYNFVKKEWTIVTPEQGLKHFYRQLITGDTSDNIQGCPKVGQVGATRSLEGATSELDFFNRTRDCYHRSYAKNIYHTEELSQEQQQFVDAQILMNGRCLKIRTTEGEVWEFPKH